MEPMENRKQPETLFDLKTVGLKGFNEKMVEQNSQKEQLQRTQLDCPGKEPLKKENKIYDKEYDKSNSKQLKVLELRNIKDQRYLTNKTNGLKVYPKE